MTHKEHTFYIQGMHCASCVIYLEETLVGNVGVDSVKVDFKQCAMTISGEFTDDQEMLAKKLTKIISGNGYTLSLERVSADNKYREFLIATPIAVIVIICFFLLEQIGFVNIISSESFSYTTAVMIGLIASVSTCLAVVGGLVLSLSANSAKNNSNSKEQIMFHVGRLAGFFVLGGVIGSLGRFFELGILGSAILGIIVAIVMLILGLNLLDIFQSLKHLQPKFPSIFARHSVRVRASSHVSAPLLIGIGTFFLPCGFTQSMQVYTLTTGSFISGGLIMLAFALGTLPMLALISFGAFEIGNRSWKGTFFKAVGIVIVALALFNVWNSLIALNII